MSHFVVLVLTNEKVDSHSAAQSVVDNALAPYSENLECDEREEDCYCVGQKAEKEACEKVEAKAGRKFTDIRDEYWRAHQKDETLEWDAFPPVAEFEKLRKQFIEEHPLKGKPADDCDECEGTGTRKTTSNEVGYWDWYEIGGRWAGLYSGYDPNKDPRNLETCHQCGGTGKRDDKLGKDMRKKDPKYTCNGCGGTGKSRKFSNAPHEGDIVPVRAVLATMETVGTTYAVVTLDGEWVQHGEMGWFGMSKDEMTDDQWNTEFRKILEENMDATAIVVDAHT